MTMGEKLRDLREDKGLPLKTVATELAMSVSTLSNYEHDRHQPDTKTLRDLALYYHTSTDYLLGLSEVSYDSAASVYIGDNRICTGTLLEVLSTASSERRYWFLYMLNLFLRDSATDRKKTDISE